MLRMLLLLIVTQVLLFSGLSGCGNPRSVSGSARQHPRPSQVREEAIDREDPNQEVLKIMKPIIEGVNKSVELLQEKFSAIPNIPNKAPRQRQGTDEISSSSKYPPRNPHVLNINQIRLEAARDSKLDLNSLDSILNTTDTTPGFPELTCSEALSSQTLNENLTSVLKHMQKEIQTLETKLQGKP